MHNSSLFFVIIISFIFSNCKEKTQKASLSVEITNIENDTALVFISPYNEKFRKNAIKIPITEGRIQLDTAIEELHVGKIITNDMFVKLGDGEKFLIDSKIIDFFIKPDEKVRVLATTEKFKTNYKIEGKNQLNQQLLKYRAAVIHDFEESSRLWYQIENSYLNNSSDSIIEILSLEEEKANEEYLNKTNTFIEQNPNLELSAFLLSMRQKEEIVSLFPALTPEVKQSTYGKFLKEKIAVWDQLKIGSKVPDFEYTTLNGDKINLSDFQGKFVVLDFWGSWCTPCLMEMPRLSGFYEENKTNIEVIGIACRDNKVTWEKAIKKLNLNWIQILNDKDKLDLSMTFGIEGYPTKVIINPEGKLEGVYLGSRTEFYTRMDELLTQKN